VGSRRRHNLERFKTASSALVEKVGRGITNVVAPGKKKSPITPILEQSEILMNSSNNALGESRKVLTLLGQLRNAHKDALCALARVTVTKAHSEQGPSEQDGALKTQLAECLVKIAVLEVFEKRNVMHRIQGEPLSDEEKVLVNQRLEEFASRDGAWVAALELGKRIAPPASAKIDANAITPAGASKSGAIPEHLAVTPDLLKKSFEALVEAPEGDGRDSEVDRKSECLRDWFTQIRAHLTSMGAAQTVDWDSMESAFRRWEGTLPEIETPGFMSDEAFISCILNIKEGLDLGSSIKGTDGPEAGIDSSILSRLLSDDGEQESENASDSDSKKNLVANLLAKAVGTLAAQAVSLSVDVVAGGVVAPRVKAIGGREVFFNLGLSAHALELTFGSQRKVVVELGAFGRVGPNIAIEHDGKTYGVQAGASAGFSVCYEETQPIDVVAVRMGGRNGRDRDMEEGAEDKPKIPPGMNGDQMRKDQFTPVLRAMWQPVSPAEIAAGITSPLHRALLEDDEVSVTLQQYNDMPTRTAKLMGSLGAGAIARLGGAGRVGVNALEAKGEIAKGFEKINVMEEKQGAVRYRRETQMVSGKGGIATGVIAGSGTTEEAGVVVGGMPLSYSADLLSQSMMARRQIIIEDNDVLASSYTQLTHQTFNGFQNSVLSRLDEWADSIIRRRQPSLPPELRCAMPPPGTDPHSDIAAYGPYLKLHAAMKTVVRTYLKRLDEQRQELEEKGTAMNMTYSEWLLLKPDVAKEVNRREAVARAARLAGETKQADALEESAKQLTRQQDSWVPTLMFGTKSLKRTVNSGLNLGVVSQKRVTAESTALTSIDG